MPVITGGVTNGTGLDAPLLNAGAPTTATYISQAVVGSLLIDTTNGKLYICTANDGSTVTWTLVGSQV